MKGKKASRFEIFWMAVIGQLIICCDEKEAKTILRSIFIVATFVTIGSLPNDEKSLCQKHKDILDKLIKGKCNV